MSTIVSSTASSEEAGTVLRDRAMHDIMAHDKPRSRLPRVGEGREYRQPRPLRRWDRPMPNKRNGLRSRRRRPRGEERCEPAYPAHWESDIALRDGSAAHLRPIRPTDADALQEFHQRQSEHSRYLRFYAPMPRLSSRDLDRFTHVDHVDRVAFVVLVGQDIIAVGRYDRVSPTSAEVAFNVSDSRQGTGLASVLLEHLAAAARER